MLVPNLAPSPHPLQHRRKLLQRRLHVVNDLLGQHVRVGEVVGIFGTHGLEASAILYFNPLLGRYI
jgi:hypothetical protein